ncbi:hypothetical protein PV328_007801 [Microctonus aethiopoides]|uniref:Uncharacterized protein n=1 Tax=Microctonus aethiopoides TaxID=144406 RepID=A0AA39C9M9_9HYME|nr:hypothetical protein PV328_007801 [Microctonus aethiopoides]
MGTISQKIIKKIGDANSDDRLEMAIVRNVAAAMFLQHSCNIHIATLPLECYRNVAAMFGMLCKVRNIAVTFLQHSALTGEDRTINVMREFERASAFLKTI